MNYLDSITIHAAIAAFATPYYWPGFGIDASGGAAVDAPEPADYIPAHR